MKNTLMTLLIVASLGSICMAAKPDWVENLGKQTEEDKAKVVERESKKPSWDPEFGNLNYNADGSYKDSNPLDDVSARDENLFVIGIVCFFIIIFFVSTGHPLGLLIALILFIIGGICTWAAW